MPDLRAFLTGGGEMGALIRAHDWDDSPLGPIHDWPQSLRSSLGICLRSSSACSIFWGPQSTFLYNDAWAALLAERHPGALGRPASEVMADIWPLVAGEVASVLEQAETVNRVDRHLLRNRDGRTFDSYWSYTLLPIASEDGTIGGVLVQARETTEQVLKAQRDAFILRLTETLQAIDQPAALLRVALSELGAELGAGRIGYGEVDSAEGTFAILGCWTDGSMIDISGAYPVGHFSQAGYAALSRNEAVAIEDSAAPGVLGEAAAERWRAIGCRAALVVPLISHGRYHAVLFAHEVEPRRWSAHDEALLRAAIERISENLGRARAEAALRHSEERYRRVFEQANDIILTADLDQIITDCNPAGAAAMGLSRERIIGRPIADFVTPEGFEQTTRMLRQKLARGGTTRHEIDVLAATGETLHWEINSSLAIDRDGRVVGLHAIARDVTERRRHEERQRLLVNELNHRVKNTLSLVQGLALQTFQDGRDINEARSLFQERLAALAVAHDLLTRESWEGATLDQLVGEAIGHHDSSGDRIRWSGPSVTLSPKAAVSLVMALHELSTNAAKYGALSADGDVEVSWDVVEGERLRIEWRERDGPPVKPPARRGFGLRMIERALASDLSGQARLEFDPAGLICRIEAPLVEISPRGEQP